MPTFGDPDFDNKVNSLRISISQQEQEKSRRMPTLRDLESYRTASRMISIAKEVARVALNQVDPNLSLFREKSLSGLQAWFKGVYPIPDKKHPIPAWQLIGAVQSENYGYGEMSRKGGNGLALSTEGTICVYSYYRDITSGIIKGELKSPENFAHNHNVVGYDTGHRQSAHEQLELTARGVENYLKQFAARLN